ncbi:di-heme-cytochrome C peroxidase [Bradyrhizobium sp.]|uniref:di-heme-cytochrome C peroxidase n=1 Tax=Bradyrhizobium sp. TaxID=376 RepID=UPI003C7445C8
MRRKTTIFFGLLAVTVATYLKDDIKKVWNDIHVRIVEYQPPAKTIWLNQNVAKDRLSWFYHADQGTRTFGIPFEWFMALEQPTVPWLLFTAAAPFHETAYLDRYGFIADTVVPLAPGKPPPLPIGFARGGAILDETGAPWRNPRTKADMTAIGLTCAACHTGRLTYRNTAVVIDGGSALTNLYELKKGLGLSLLLTRYWPGRFARFADAVLGAGSTAEDRVMLRVQLDQVLNQYKAIKALEDGVASASIVEGYGRLDALNRIGNQVFSIDLKNPSNYAAHSAPVHFPRIWNAPWFTWVQYNGSIAQPMIRNAGESLGVSSELNLTEPARGFFKSSARIDTLYEMEKMIAGDPPLKEFSGLTSPKWPGEILPPINWELAKAGAALYKSHCRECHLPAVESKALPPEDRDEFFRNRKWWTVNDAGQPLLDVERIPIGHVGTDSAQADDMASRIVALPADLGLKDNRFGFALRDVVEKVVNSWYEQKKISGEDRQRMNGYRPNEIDAPRKYKVRPLNGVWATPPYLHNGSVPNIYALLSPIEERPSTFYLGNREYDPEKLGYRSEERIANGFLFDTSLRGNSNRGHEFSNAKREGVIGPALSEGDRRALIEFIKTL